MLGVDINFSNSILPEEILSINSSEPIISAPDFFASSTLESSHTTATLIFFPVPPGKLAMVLKFTSPFFCLLLI